MALHLATKFAARAISGTQSLGRRGFAVTAIKEEKDFTSKIAASPKAVAYYTAAYVIGVLARSFKFRRSFGGYLQLVWTMPYDCTQDG